MKLIDIQKTARTPNLQLKEWLANNLNKVEIIRLKWNEGDAPSSIVKGIPDLKPADVSTIACIERNKGNDWSKRANRTPGYTYDKKPKATSIKNLLKQLNDAIIEEQKNSTIEIKVVDGQIKLLMLVEI